MYFLLGGLMGLLKGIGFALVVIGILLSFTVLGAIIGVPMIILGSIMFFATK
jgi:hypothetical protein